MKKWLLAIPILLITSQVYAATISWSKTFADGQVLAASDLETLKTNVTDVVNAGGGPVTLTANQTLSGDNTYSGASTFSGAITASSTITANGNVTIGNAVTDNLTLTSAIQGASPFILDGATDDTATVTIAIYDEATSVTYGISDMGENGSFIMSTLDNTAGDLDDVNAVWGVSNGLRFEGATANDFETTVSPTDATADRTITLPNRTITVGDSSYDTGTYTGNDTGSRDITVEFTPTFVTIVSSVNDMCTAGSTYAQHHNGANQTATGVEITMGTDKFTIGSGNEDCNTASDGYEWQAWRED